MACLRGALAEQIGQLNAGGELRGVVGSPSRGFRLAQGDIVLTVRWVGLDSSSRVRKSELKTPGAAS